ncbi:hypothetical protein ACIQGZ_17520 [Streptomyces sp. NPDC092296]|uniref:hypothetical protein n=1 Tax=Streptomyces sp. NPDC092296 TaxID=3366012 RepID=UPI0038053A8F
MTAPATPQMKDRTMTELAVPEQHLPATAPAPSPFAVQSSIAQWANEADLAFQLANRLAPTSFIPSTMRGKVGDITACLLAGNELGLPPMAALKSMDVIHGTPGLRAHAMRGLVQSKGHEVELVESTDTVCRMRGRRKGAESWQTVVWTIGRAQLAGFPAKNPNYKTQPANMLVARATGEICRLIASDALHGVPYTTEELRDSESRVTAVQAGAPVTAAEILGRKAAPAPMPQDAPAVQVAPGAEPADIWDRLSEARRVRGWGEEQAEAEFEAWSGGDHLGAAEEQQVAAFIDYMVEGEAA